MLEKIRTSQSGGSFARKAVFSLLIFAFGVLLGVCAKALDETPVNELPTLFQALDIGNFLSRLAIWIFLGMCLAVYSRTPGRAALNVFLFFLGMVGSYYLYSALAARFFPRFYALIWFGITAVSPPSGLCLLVCKGKRLGGGHSLRDPPRGTVFSGGAAPPGNSDHLLAGGSGMAGLSLGAPEEAEGVCRGDRSLPGRRPGVAEYHALLGIKEVKK